MSVLDTSVGGPLLAFIEMTDEVRRSLIENGIVLAVVIVAWLLFVRIGHRFVRGITERVTAERGILGEERGKRIATLWAVSRAAVAVVFLVAFVLLSFDIWGIPIGPLLAVGSVVGVALGFGMQDLVKDVIAGLAIIAEDQYGLGDVVKIADVTGTVEAIRLRTTVLRDLDGHVHHVPNGSVVVATNMTQEYSQVVMDVAVSYETDIDEALAVLVDEAHVFSQDPEWSDTFLEPPTLLGVEALGDSGVTIRMVFRVAPALQWPTRREFLRRIKVRLDAEGIEIPFAHVTIVTRPDVAADTGAGE